MSGLLSLTRLADSKAEGSWRPVVSRGVFSSYADPDRWGGAYWHAVRYRVQMTSLGSAGETR